MKNIITKNSLWLYAGPGDGKGLKHMVLGVEHGNVTTWSEPDRDPENGGYSWRGSADDFIQQFKPCAPAK